MLSEKYSVTGIPTLVIIDASSGATINTEGRRLVMTNPDGFPWKWISHCIVCISFHKSRLYFAFTMLSCRSVVQCSDV